MRRTPWRALRGGAKVWWALGLAATPGVAVALIGLAAAFNDSPGMGEIQSSGPAIVLIAVVGTSVLFAALWLLLYVGDLIRHRVRG